MLDIFGLSVEIKKIAMLKKIVLHRFKMSVKKLDVATFKVSGISLDAKIVRDAVAKAAPAPAVPKRGGLMGYLGP